MLSKLILITGATDGIGLMAAKGFIAAGHRVLMHGRNEGKLRSIVTELEATAGGGVAGTLIADLSDRSAVEAMADAVIANHQHLDVLINNAGVLKTNHPTTTEGMDRRFVVNALAPYRLTQRLLPLMNSQGRVINLSSAAQAPIDLNALVHGHPMDDMSAYAQSKLAITLWSRALGRSLGDNGPSVVAINPGSLLATKMVREGFGIAGSDVTIGSDILIRAALSDEFAGTTGAYFDNDSGRFASPHADALDDEKVAEIVAGIERASGHR